MNTPLNDYAADHQFLVEAAAQAAGIADPAAFDAGPYRFPLVNAAVRGPLVPLAGALVREWSIGSRKYWTGAKFGARLYAAGGIKFARVEAVLDGNQQGGTYDFFVVARKDYADLFRLALRATREKAKPTLPPVMSAEQFAVFRQNTLGYLDRENLKRIRELGGRPKRGLLLTGPPGNGKTSACRWLWTECVRHGHEYKLVTPDAYQAARGSCNPVAAVKELFGVSRRGVIFFDDLDIALRDRDTVKETDDQAVFLSALDGIEVNEGVVYVFTTNCGLDLIDPAFKRPGRIDLVLQFPPPDAALRLELMGRWHPDIRAGIDENIAAAETDGFSFAEVEELKNLLILRHLEAGVWDWAWAMHQFKLNRAELASRTTRPVGFANLAAAVNGNGSANGPA
jgi:hypothetical protein